MRLHVMSIFVDDRTKARDFYVDKLGFAVKQDIRIGPHHLLTLVSPDQPGGMTLRLDSIDRPADAAFQAGCFADRIMAASFEVDDVDAEVARLRAIGVRFTIDPWGPLPHFAVFDDTCGNLIGLYQKSDHGDHTMEYMRIDVADAFPDDGKPLPGSA